MKKFLLLCAGLTTALLSFAGSGTSWKDAVNFSWETANEQQANTTIWYKIDLSAVLSDENILLYINNMSQSVANITAEPFADYGGSLSSLNEKTSKAIQPEKNYAYEMSGSLFQNLNLKEVYIRMATDQPISFSAEPVLPGIKDLDCLNALDFSFAGTSISTGKAWYRVNLEDIIAQPAKTVEITVLNQGTATANIVGGLSLDCPSTGVTSRSITLAAGQEYRRTLKRSYLDMIAVTEVYVQTTTTQPLLVTARVVDAPFEPVGPEVTGEINFTADQTYSLAASSPQWYHITTADWNEARRLPELTVVNKGDAQATISVQLVYQKQYSSSIERAFSLAKGQIRVEDIQKSYIQNIVDRTADAYILITSSQPIEFSARMKNLIEGTACQSAREFDWNGTVQQANTTVWYKVGIEEAKAMTDKDIELTLRNQSSAAAAVTAQVAFECPTAGTTDMARTVAAGAELTKVINRSLYANLLNDTVWVGVTANQQLFLSARYVQTETITPINICNETVILFDVNGEGALQGGATEVWYKVSIDDMTEDPTKVPEVTVKNLGTGAATVTAELAFDCEINTAMPSRTISLPVDGSYVKAPTYSMLQSINPDKEFAFIRVTTDQPISIQSAMKFENEGTSCQTPVQFNWTLGNYQTADTEVWYAVDIAEAKAAAGKSIRLQLTNKELTAATVTADISFDCPYSGLTSYTYTLAGNRTVTKDLTHAVVQSVASDVVYIRVKTDKAVHLGASLVTEEVVTDDQCSAAIDFDWENGHQQPAGEQWYRVVLESLRGELVPELTLVNEGDAKATITAEFTFVCPTTATTTKTITLGAGQTLVKQLEKNLIDAVDPAYNYAWVKVTTNEPLRFNAGLVNPNQGQDCLHPVDFDYENGHLQPAGDSVWYKVDIAVIKDTPRRALSIGIVNKDGILGEATAEFYFSCDDAEPFEAYTQTIAANARLEKNLGRALLASLKPDSIFILLHTTQQDSVYADFYDEEEVNIEACAEAKKMLYNTIVPQPAGDKWYYVNIKDIRENTTDDAQLTIWNSSTTNQLTAEVAFECPVTEKMQDRTITLQPDQVYTRTLPRSYIDNVVADTGYLHIIAQENVSFEVTLNDPRGLACGNGILFDWKEGNVHPADTTLWYTVMLKDTLEKYSDKDLKLIVENLTDNDVKAEVEVKGDCAEESLLNNYTNTLAAGDSATKIVSNAMLKGYEYLNVCLQTDGNVRLTVEMVDKVRYQFKDTLIVYGEVCEGGYYEHNISDTVIQHLIEGNKPETWKWTNTVEFVYEETLLADSIITFEVHPIQTPEFFGKEEFVAPIVEVGQAIDVTAATNDLLEKFKTAREQVSSPYQDTIAEVTGIGWEKLNDRGRFVDLTNDKLSFNITEVGLRYYIVTSCEDEGVNYPDTLWYDVNRSNERLETVDTIVCNGTVFTVASGKQYTITEDIQINDTVVFEISSDILGDSVYTYNISVWKDLVLPQLTALPQAQVGKPVDVTAADAELKAAIKAQQDADPLIVPVTAVTWEIKNGDAYQPLTDDLIDKSVSSITLRYVLLTECETLYGADIVVSVQKAFTFEKEIADTVCVGTEYVSRLGTHVITEDTQWSDTVTFQYSETQLADSVYIYDIKVYRPLTLPASINDIAPLAVCGQLLHTDEATEQLMTLLTSLLQPINSTIESIYWEAEVNGVYTKTSDLPALSSAIDQLSVRYVVITSCGDVLTGTPLTVHVQTPNPDNTPDLGQLPAVSKYNDWLLMIHFNEFQSLGYVPAEDQVQWYKVVGSPDYEINENNDEHVATGFYYTIGEQLIGDFYAVIHIPAADIAVCDVTLRTRLLSCKATATLSIAPSMVAPGEDINISGLNPELTYTLSVYDLMGVLVSRVAFSGTETYTMQAQTMAGYYMVHISDDARTTTLKYIVK